MFVKLQTEKKKKKKTLTLIKNQIRCDSEQRIKDNWILFHKDKINWLLQQNKPEPLPSTSPWCKDIELLGYKPAGRGKSQVTFWIDELSI